jgi:anaerobic selenocysteine-containing dehydrogenase
LIPIHRLFDRGTTIQPSSVLAAHLVGREVWLNPEHAARLGIAAGDEVEVVADGSIVRARASIDSAVPRETVLAPRSAGFPFPDPTEVEVRRP